MNESEYVTVQLTQKERETLLRGLRFVRSAVMLEIRDPSPRDDERRRDEIQAIDALAARLNAETAAHR